MIFYTKIDLYFLLEELQIQTDQEKPVYGPGSQRLDFILTFGGRTLLMLIFIKNLEQI